MVRQTSLLCQVVHIFSIKPISSSISLKVAAEAELMFKFTWDKEWSKTFVRGP